MTPVSASQPQTAPLLNLPADCINIIVSFLKTPFDVQSFLLTNKKLYYLRYDLAAKTLLPKYHFNLPQNSNERTSALHKMLTSASRIREGKITAILKSYRRAKSIRSGEYYFPPFRSDMHYAINLESERLEILKKEVWFNKPPVINLLYRFDPWSKQNSFCLELGTLEIKDNELAIHFFKKDTPYPFCSHFYALNDNRFLTASRRIGNYFPKGNLTLWKQSDLNSTKIDEVEITNLTECWRIGENAFYLINGTQLEKWIIKDEKLFKETHYPLKFSSNHSSEYYLLQNENFLIYKDSQLMLWDPVSQKTLKTLMMFKKNLMITLLHSDMCLLQSENDCLCISTTHLEMLWESPIYSWNNYTFFETCAGLIGKKEQSITLIDTYTGRLLWEKTFEDLGIQATKSFNLSQRGCYVQIDNGLGCTYLLDFSKEGPIKREKVRHALIDFWNQELSSCNQSIDKKYIQKELEQLKKQDRLPLANFDLKKR